MPYLRAHKVKGHSHWLGIALAEREKPGDAGDKNLDSLIPIYSIFSVSPNCAGNLGHKLYQVRS